MRVLIVISILAASGVLWASLAAAKHVRRARRQRSWSKNSHEHALAVRSAESAPELSAEPLIDAEALAFPRIEASSLAPPPPRAPVAASEVKPHGPHGALPSKAEVHVSSPPSAVSQLTGRHNANHSLSLHDTDAEHATH